MKINIAKKNLFLILICFCYSIYAETLLTQYEAKQEYTKNLVTQFNTTVHEHINEIVACNLKLNPDDSTLLKLRDEISIEMDCRTNLFDTKFPDEFIVDKDGQTLFLSNDNSQEELDYAYLNEYFELLENNLILRVWLSEKQYYDLTIMFIDKKDNGFSIGFQDVNKLTFNTSEVQFENLSDIHYKIVSKTTNPLDLKKLGFLPEAKVKSIINSEAMDRAKKIGRIYSCAVSEKVRNNTQLQICSFPSSYQGLAIISAYVGVANGKIDQAELKATSKSKKSIIPLPYKKVLENVRKNIECLKSLYSHDFSSANELSRAMEKTCKMNNTDIYLIKK